MGVWLTIGCYVAAFSPAIVLFARLIAHDPLKIILFVLGCFIWLVSLLLTSLVWFAVVPLREDLVFAVGTGIVFQNAARVVCFFLLKAAQRGLGALANPSSTAHVRVTGVMPLANSRHLLAVVCGLGMGFMSALFLRMNAFAAVSGSGVFGGIREALGSDSPVAPASLPRLLPLYWALSALLLSLLHVVWTVLVWDSCHALSLRVSQSMAAAAAAGDGPSGAAPRLPPPPPPPTTQSPLLGRKNDHWWLVPAVVAVLTHVISCATSFLSSSGLHSVDIGTKGVLFVALTFYAYTIVRHDSPIGLAKEVLFAVRDWVTLSWLRAKVKEIVAGGGSSTSTRGADAAVPLQQRNEDVAVRDPTEGGTTRQRRAVRT